jgi:hypothetical protein
MKTMRFKTRILEEGIIQIPYNTSLLNKEVEVIIFPQPEKEKKRMKAHDFVKKWAGFIKSSNSEDPRYEYIMEKYK